MSLLTPASQPWPDRFLALLRIVAGLMFFTMGTMVVFGYPHSNMVPPFDPTTQIGFGKLLETIGGALIVLGLFTRPVAFILAGEMAVTYFQFHAPQAFYPVLNNGVSAVFYCFLFLYFMVAGGGAWSIDRVLAARRGH